MDLEKGHTLFFTFSILFESKFNKMYQIIMQTSKNKNSFKIISFFFFFDVTDRTTFSNMKKVNMRSSVPVPSPRDQRNAHPD